MTQKHFWPPQSSNCSYTYGEVLGLWQYSKCSKIFPTHCCFCHFLPLL